MITWHISLLFLSMTLYGQSLAENTISASGGGIVKAGENLTLTLVVGHEWERCFWFRFENAEHTKDSHCSFDFDKVSANVSLHKCSPENMSSVMMASGDNTENCEITVTGVDDTDTGVWAARLDTDREVVEMEVVVAEEIKELSLNTTVVKGKEGNIRCAATGGNPPPIIDIQFFTFVENGNLKSEETINSSAGENSTGSLFFTPSMEHHGKIVECTATQLDGDNKTLFTRTVNGSINVTFPPRPQNKTITITALLSSNAILPISVKSNPPPSSVTWVVDFCQNDKSANETTETIKKDAMVKENDKKDDTSKETDKNLKKDNITKETTKKEDTKMKSSECRLTFPLGHGDDKYIASNISINSSSNSFLSKMHLEIVNLEEKDYSGKYSVIVHNIVGSQEYNFKLKQLVTPIIDITNATTIESKNNATDSDDEETDTTADSQTTTSRPDSVIEDGTAKESDSSFVEVVAVVGSLAILMLLLILVVLIFSIYKLRQGTFTVTPAPPDLQQNKENNNAGDQLELV